MVSKGFNGRDLWLMIKLIRIKISDILISGLEVGKVMFNSNVVILFSILLCGLVGDVFGKEVDGVIIIFLV